MFLNAISKAWVDHCKWHLYGSICQGIPLINDIIIECCNHKSIFSLQKMHIFIIILILSRSHTQQDIWDKHLCKKNKHLFSQKKSQSFNLEKVASCIKGCSILRRTRNNRNKLLYIIPSTRAKLQGSAGCSFATRQGCHVWKTETWTHKVMTICNLALTLVCQEKYRAFTTIGQERLQDFRKVIKLLPTSV